MAITTNLFTLVSNKSLGASFNSPGIDIAQFNGFSIQAVYTYVALEDSAGTFKLQGSNDNINYSDVDNATISFSATSTNDMFDISVFNFKYIRASIVNSSGTGGTVTMTFHGKQFN